MRRRICLAAMVVGAGPLAAGSLVASAAAATPSVIVLKCTARMTAAPVAGTNVVDQPPTGGWMYGPIACPRQGFGRGIEASSFTVPLSGDTIGSFTQYLSAGSIKGSFNLVPQEGGPVTSNFESADWVGEFTVTGGTGIYKGIKSNRNAGKLTCSSTDTVHLVCAEKVRVKVPGAR